MLNLSLKNIKKNVLIAFTTGSIITIKLKLLVRCNFRHFHFHRRYSYNHHISHRPIFRCSGFTCLCVYLTLPCYFVAMKFSFLRTLILKSNIKNSALFTNRTEKCIWNKKNNAQKLRPYKKYYTPVMGLRWALGWNKIERCKL